MRSNAPTDLLQMIAYSLNVQVFVVQEPHIHKNHQILGIPSTWKYWLSGNGKTGVITTVDLSPILVGLKENAVAIKIAINAGPLTIISAYSAPPNHKHTMSESGQAGISEALQNIDSFLQNLGNEKIIIGADLNAHYIMW